METEEVRMFLCVLLALSWFLKVVSLLWRCLSSSGSRQALLYCSSTQIGMPGIGTTFLTPSSDSRKCPIKGLSLRYGAFQLSNHIPQLDWEPRPSEGSPDSLSHQDQTLDSDNSEGKHAHADACVCAHRVYIRIYIIFLVMFSCWSRRKTEDRRVEEQLFLH